MSTSTLTFSATVRRHLPVFGIFALLAIAATLISRATPLAGSTIGNQASATYTDSSNATRTATSNVTLTIIQQIASLTLTAGDTKNVAPGGQAVFAHSITNTGNGSDTFTLSVAQLAGDNFDLTGAAIYADANGDGLPDNSTAITSTPLLTAGSRYSFVVTGVVPSSQTSGQVGRLSVSAASTFTPTTTASATDTANVSSNAVIQVTQSISATTGASPSGPYTVTLTYTNTGNSAASNLLLTDLIPTGFEYYPGNAHWSVSGATTLTDAAGGDPAGIAYDYGATQAGRVTATVASVQAGQSGTVTFQVKVAPSVAPGAINNTAAFSYNDSSSTVGPFNTNTITFNVTQNSSLTFTGDTVGSAPQGGTVRFTNVVKNTGLGTETYDITLSPGNFPTGTTFRLVQSDGATALLDSNHESTPDTGPLAPGASFTVILVANLPTGATGGPFSIVKTATAASDHSVTATATDTLTAISNNSVDLMADAAGTLGVGAGPEASPVVTEIGSRGTTVRFTLRAKNGSNTADVFRFDVSSTTTFPGSLPTGWSVVYRDTSGGVITQTSALATNGAQNIYADVTIPADQAPGTQDIYFRALSPNTGASDKLHVAISVGTNRRLAFSAGSNGQIFPGGTTVYNHTLTNEGNVTEGDGSGSIVALAANNSQSGWNAVIYFDANGNGIIDSGDPIVTDTSFVSNGAAGLAAGESVPLLVKVFSPAGAVVGASNSTTITATTSNGILASTVPPVASVSDLSTVILSEIRLVKEQALDLDADGIADTAFGMGNITMGATPGACIRYRVTVTNTGSEAALNVVINDATPTFTTYHATVPAATSAGSVTSTPNNGDTGVLVFSLGTLAPGASASVTFGVKINL
jgi:uncharacterized repeat protein (TIGR01451 family)